MSRFFLEAWLFGDPGVELAVEGRLPECSVSDSSPGFPDSTLQADITSWVEGQAEVLGLPPRPSSLAQTVLFV